MQAFSRLVPPSRLPCSTDLAPPSLPDRNENVSRPCCVFIYEDKFFEKVSGKDALDILHRCPDLTSLALAFLHSEYPQVRFFYVENPKTWLFIRMLPERMRFPAARVILEYWRTAPPNGLSVRELDVLTLLVAGLSNPGIARQLTVSPRTVAKHVENIFKKLGVRNRVHAGRVALNMGLVRYPTPGKGREGCSVLRSLEQAASRASAPGDAPARAALGQPPPILIGVPLPLGGPGSANAAEMLNGATLALSEINARGGIHGRELRLLTADCNVQSPESVRSAYASFINNDVDAISAGYSCAETAIHAMVGEYGAPYLHSATMESVVDSVRGSPAKLGNIFQVCASDVKYGPGLARFILKLEDSGSWRPASRRISVVMPQWSGLDIGLPEAEKLLSARNWSIDIVSSPHVGGRNWRGVSALLQRLGPGVIVLASYLVEDGIGFQDAFWENPTPALVYMLYNPSVPDFCIKLGKKAQGVLWATTSGIYTDGIGMRFRRMYRETFGEPSGQSHAGLAYDRIHVLANAWARVGNPRRFDKVARDLRNAVHRGVNGAYFLGGAGQVGLAFPDDSMDPSISKAHLIFQVQDGAHRILSPTPYSDGTFQLPCWHPF